MFPIKNADQSGHVWQALQHRASLFPSGFHHGIAGSFSDQARARQESGLPPSPFFQQAVVEVSSWAALFCRGFSIELTTWKHVPQTLSNPAKPTHALPHVAMTLGLRGLILHGLRSSRPTSRGQACLHHRKSSSAAGYGDALAFLLHEQAAAADSWSWVIR